MDSTEKVNNKVFLLYQSFLKQIILQLKIVTNMKNKSKMRLESAT